jgi:hypothetical protein
VGRAASRWGALTRRGLSWLGRSPGAEAKKLDRILLRRSVLPLQYQ